MPLFIVIYEKKMRTDGGLEERPLAFFRNPIEANVFLEMLACNGRRVFARSI